MVKIEESKIPESQIRKSTFFAKRLVFNAKHLKQYYPGTKLLIVISQHSILYAKKIWNR